MRLDAYRSGLLSVLEEGYSTGRWIVVGLEIFSYEPGMKGADSRLIQQMEDKLENH